MAGRVIQFVLRVAGWLLTPLVLLIAAAIGATIGLVVASRFPATAGLVLTALFAFAAAVATLVYWIRLLRRRPDLQARLAVTPEGIPDAEVVARLVHPGEP